MLTGQTPDQIPMARLADYMAQLAVLFGEQDCVHFARVEGGSVALVANIESGTPLQKVQQRINRVRLGTAPSDATGAFAAINKMVSSDRGTAQLKFGSAVILRFPGTAVEDVAAPITMHDHGALTGKLYAMFEGNNGTISARIRPRIGTSYIPCTVEPAAVRELRGFLTEAVRVQGRGIWARSSNGSWACKSFHIVQVYGVKDASLRDAINQLRAIDADWPDDPLGHWVDERDGAETKGKQE